MKKKVLSSLVIVCFCFPAKSRGDIFGGDVAVLTQILANAIMQLSKLKQLLDTGNDTLELAREVHRGINDSLRLFQTFPIQSDPGIYADWLRVQDALRGLHEIYGESAVSPESRVETDTDESVAEAISLNNSLYEYSGNIDAIGDKVRQFSDNVSPAWSPKVTAQTLGIVLQVLNQSLRAQATGLKLKAQSMALQNHREKELTKYLLSNSQTLEESMKNEKKSFDIPRF